MEAKPIRNAPPGIPLLPEEMSRPEIDQFLTCARVGRIGLALREGPYIVPVGYGYAEGKIFFHTCREGLKIEAIRTDPKVCFEVDEYISDAFLARSVIILGRAELIQDNAKKIPYLEKMMDKYRVSSPSANTWPENPTEMRKMNRIG